MKLVLALSLLAFGANAQQLPNWSTTAASNNAAAPNGWPTGMNPSDVKLSGRQMMAATRTWYEDSQWVNFGYTPTWLSATSFRISASTPSDYHVSRRVRTLDSVGYTYGTISNVAYGSGYASVTIVPDSGTISNSLSVVSIGAASANSPSIVSSTIGLGDIYNLISNSIITIPAGTVQFYAGTSTSLSTGWAVAYGQSVSRTGVYANLFAAIGTTYGTADGNSFNLPDCRGRVIAGLDNMGGTAASRVSFTTSGISGTVLGAAGGDQRMQQHNHSVTDPGHSHAARTSSAGLQANGSGNLLGNSVSNIYGDSNASGTMGASAVTANTTGITVDVSGSGVSQNMQPTIMMNCIIKY